MLLPQGTLLIECKRIESPRKVEVRAGHALKQLRRGFVRIAARSRCYGIVALDVGQLLHPQQGLAIAADRLVARRELRLQISRFDHDYQLDQMMGQDKNILAIWHQLMTPVATAFGREAMTMMTSLVVRLAPDSGYRAAVFESLKPVFELRGWE